MQYPGFIGGLGLVVVAPDVVLVPDGTMQPAHRLAAATSTKRILLIAS